MTSINIRAMIRNFTCSRFFLFGILACSSIAGSRDKTPDSPTNIIFLIGDGMGLSAVSTTFYFEDGSSEFKRFKHIGLSKTSSATHKVTDSGASGTALATGQKTYNGAIGVDTLKAPIQNIVELTAALDGVPVWLLLPPLPMLPRHHFTAMWKVGVWRTNLPSSYSIQKSTFSPEEVKISSIKRKDGVDLFPMADEKGFIIDTTSLAAPGTLKPGQKYGFLLCRGRNAFDAERKGRFPAQGHQAGH